MKKTTNRKLYLTMTAIVVAISFFVLYKFLTARWYVQLGITLLTAACYFFDTLRKPIANELNKWYCLLIYENSTFWEIFYDTACSLFPSPELSQINYGFAPLTNEGKLIELSKQDEAERMSLQLYYRTATCLDTRKDLEGLTILEVSSGRGGGIDFLTRNFPIKKIIGLDLSSNNIEWCNKTYSGNSKLQFVLGNAETFVDDGTLPAESIDVIISVDSAHLYPHFDRFIDQCAKVLRKGGRLCISDFMQSEKMPAREDILANSGLKQLLKEETTPNILHAMDLDGERRKRLVETHAHPLLRHYFRYQSGAKGSRIYNLLKTGEFVGAGWVLQKPDN
jgi:ubiquinone/menaquinone biosynthesis C-methylase UbiE